MPQEPRDGRMFRAAAWVLLSYQAAWGVSYALGGQFHAFRVDLASFVLGMALSPLTWTAIMLAAFSDARESRIFNESTAAGMVLLAVLFTTVMGFMVGQIRF